MTPASVVMRAIGVTSLMPTGVLLVSVAPTITRAGDHQRIARGRGAARRSAAAPPCRRRRRHSRTGRCRPARPARAACSMARPRPSQPPPGPAGTNMYMLAKRCWAHAWGLSPAGSAAQAAAAASIWRRRMVPPRYGPSRCIPIAPRGPQQPEPAAAQSFGDSCLAPGGPTRGPRPRRVPMGIAVQRPWGPGTRSVGYATACSAHDSGEPGGAPALAGTKANASCAWDQPPIGPACSASADSPPIDSRCA